MKTQVVFVDVDDTLVRSVGSKRIPIPAVIAEVRRLKADGTVLYLWSAGGADYAHRSAEELGIVECFAGFLPKPDLVIDDQPLHLWHTTRHLYPSQVGGSAAES
jgi:cation transport ATPase